MYRKLRLPFLFAIMAITAAASAQEIGLQLNSMEAALKRDVHGTMAKVKELGIHNIELGGTYGLTFPELIKLIAVNQLNVISLHTSFDRIEKAAYSVADEARSYGAKFVVCSYAIAAGESFSAAQVDHLTDVLNKAGKILASHGLMLTYQPAGFEFVSHPDGTLFDYLVKKLDNRYVHFELDVFSVRHAGQDPVTILKKYPTRFIMLQLSDRKSGAAESSTGTIDGELSVVLGKGDVNIVEVVKTARELGIPHLFIEDLSTAALTQLPLSIDYLKSVIADLSVNTQVRK